MNKAFLAGLLVVVTFGVGPVWAEMALTNVTYAAQKRTVALNSADLPLVITRGEAFAITAQVASTSIRSFCDALECYMTADIQSADGTRLLLGDIAQERWARVWMGSQMCPRTVVLEGIIPAKQSVRGQLLKKGDALLVVRLFRMKERPQVLDYDDELAKLEMPAIIR